MQTFDIIISAQKGKEHNQTVHAELCATLVQWKSCIKIQETTGAYKGVKEACFIATLEDVPEVRAELEGLLFLYRQESLIVRDKTGIRLLFCDGTTQEMQTSTWSNTYKYFDSYVKDGDGYWNYTF